MIFGDNTNDDGAVLIFVLITVALISGAICFAYSSASEIMSDYTAFNVQETGIHYMYSTENTALAVLPGMNMNIYRHVHRLPASAPIIKTFSVPEGNIRVELSSLDNCINITQDIPPDEQQTRQIMRLIVSLGKVLKVDEHAVQRISQALLRPQPANKDLNDYHFSDQNDRKMNETYARMVPFLCRKKSPGQLVNINAINESNMPVLVVLLNYENGVSAFLQLYKRKNGGYWDNIDEFVSDMSSLIPVSSINQELLISSDRNMLLKTKFTDSQGRDFVSYSNLYSDGKRFYLARRKLKEDNMIR